MSVFIRFLFFKSRNFFFIKYKLSEKIEQLGISNYQGLFEFFYFFSNVFCFFQCDFVKVNTY